MIDEACRKAFEKLIKIIRDEANQSLSEDEYERGCNAGMRRAIALIRHYYMGDASARKDEAACAAGINTTKE